MYTTGIREATGGQADPLGAFAERARTDPGWAYIALQLCAVVEVLGGTIGLPAAEHDLSVETLPAGSSRTRSTRPAMMWSRRRISSVRSAS